MFVQSLKVNTLLVSGTASYFLKTDTRSVANAGASKFKWTIPVNYVKKIKHIHGNKNTNDLLFHYPDISTVSGQKIDWLNSQPKSGYEGVQIYGPNTIEVSNLPMGRTPEYMQERLRKFFSKFGVVISCRCINHELDPYQCQGNGYVTFLSRYAVTKALKAPLRLPGSLHYKIIRMKDLSSDKENDPEYIYKSRHWNAQILSIVSQLYNKIVEEGPVCFNTVWKGIYEIEYKNNKKPIKVLTTELIELRRRLSICMNKSRVECLVGQVAIDGAIRTADYAVYHRFRNWRAMLTAKEFDTIFRLIERDDGKLLVGVNLLSEEEFSRRLYRCGILLSQALDAEFSEYWRKGRVELPNSVKEQIKFWDHKPRLSESIQLLSRSTDFYKIYDERHLLKLKLKMQRNKRRKLLKQERMKESAHTTT